MHPFSICEVVVCVDDTPVPGRDRRDGEDWIEVGKFYRVAATMSDRHGNAGIRVGGVKDMPPRVGWFAWRFKRIESADDNFRGMMNCLTRPKTDLEVALQQSLANSSVHERTRRPYVPGMAVTWAAPGQDEPDRNSPHAAMSPRRISKRSVRRYARSVELPTL